MKYLSQPFPTALLPFPGSVWTAGEQRAFLAVGYPLAATAPVVVIPPVIPPVVAVPMRVPSIQIAPMVYRDILQGWMEPWSYYGVETLGKRTKAMANISQLHSSCVDRQRMTDMICASAIVGFRASDIFKGKELFTASATFETETPDRLTFGRERKLLIALNDKKLGIDTEEECF